MKAVETMMAIVDNENHHRDIFENDIYRTRKKRLVIPGHAPRPSGNLLALYNSIHTSVKHGR